MLSLSLLSDIHTIEHANRGETRADFTSPMPILQLHGRDELWLQQQQRLRVRDAERAAASRVQQAKPLGKLWATAKFI